MRVCLCILFLALALSGCRQSYGELYAWGDDWYVKDPSQAEAFFGTLKTKLAAEGFAESAPATGFVADNGGMMPAEGDRVYWFQGSFQGSPNFQIKLLRSGPHLETFHIMYLWDFLAYSSPNREMEVRTHGLHETLKEWVKNGGVANLPPKSD